MNDLITQLSSITDTLENLYLRLSEMLKAEEQAKVQVFKEMYPAGESVSKMEVAARISSLNFTLKKLEIQGEIRAAEGRRELIKEMLREGVV